MVDPRTAHLSRRRLITVLAAALPVGGCAVTRDDAAPPAAIGAARPSSDDPWQTLLEGNARFASGAARHPRQDAGRRRALVEGQHPIASVLTCADSRVPPELVFDQGLGDLFTIRSAGEVLDDAVIGSVEYAVEHLRVPLVVVLGHTGCGAVGAAVDVVRGGTRPRGHVGALVRAIEPAVHAVSDGRGAAVGTEEFVAACVDEQARRVAAALPERSPMVAAAIADGTTTVVAGVYDLGGGRVTAVAEV